MPQSAAKLPTGAFLPQLAAKSSGRDKRQRTIGESADPLPILQQLAANIPWYHNVILMEKVKDLSARLWYVQQTIAQGWSRNVLTLMIQSRAHARKGNLLRATRLRQAILARAFAPTSDQATIAP